MNDPSAKEVPPIRFYECELLIKTISEANSHQHWSQSKSRHSMQKKHIYLAFKDLIVPLPCTVKLSRISPRLLDGHDNLKTSFKWIVDQLAECIIRNNEPNQTYKGPGRYDNDPRIKWEYAQEKGKPQRIRVEIFT